jgi:hypothetical protein
MGTVVKLPRTPVGVPNATGPRPVRTEYSGGYSGHSKTIRNAIVNATRRMLRDSAAKRANIIVDGHVVADLDMLWGKVMITWRQKMKAHELW